MDLSSLSPTASPRRWGLIETLPSRCRTMTMTFTLLELPTWEGRGSKKSTEIKPRISEFYNFRTPEVPFQALPTWTRFGHLLRSVIIAEKLSVRARVKFRRNRRQPEINVQLLCAPSGNRETSVELWSIPGQPRGGGMTGCFHPSGCFSVMSIVSPCHRFGWPYSENTTNFDSLRRSGSQCCQNC